MIRDTIQIIKILAVLGTISSLGFYVLCLLSAWKFLRERQVDKSVRPTQPVSILKPLRGTDPEMYESFRSHCLQDYPDYEIIFGVGDANDPAIALVEQLKAEFPRHPIRLMVCAEKLGNNTKVSNLAQMARAARYEYFIVNDSDIRVEPDYLRRVLAPLTDPKIGLVTCLYRGIANSTLGSRLESLGISTDFSAGVLVAQNIERGIRFGLGSTLAFRRRDLQAIGGFEALVDYLADDYQLGSRIAALGLKVELSDVVVETFLPRYTLRTFLDHQLRWARTVRDSRFWGYVGLGMTFGLPWAALALIFAQGAAWAWALFACVVAMRVGVAVVVGRSVLRDRQVIRLLAWIPVRDFFALVVWIVSFAGHEIVWRGVRFRLESGKLIN
ncbi:MAG TPA: bacteriohopanetetrol glucosamine biosynthesis glycosyltransferase HpnI [Terriglobales bacterium]|nr:bacteriohopanetetrol glucosamine biosynthesis glycosyltransferase HpnI [Terriglobales bacterium]